MIPAKGIDKAPKYQFAVLSVRKGCQEAEMESSFAAQWQAEQMFDCQYSKWGLPETNFYLVDWDKQIVLKQHTTWLR